MIPNRLKKGDTIGVVAPSDPIVGKNTEEIQKAKQMVEKEGFVVKFSKHLLANTMQYSSSPQEKAEDIHQMFQDKEVAMIWWAKGGSNANTVFEYLDYELIKKNPKIICGYSDATSLTNLITQKTGLVTFSGTNFKTIATDETSYSFEELKKRLIEENLSLARKDEKFQTIRQGKAQGELIGGNLSLISQLITGKYTIHLENKILFLEEFSLEADPARVSSYLYYMKQNGVFYQIKGLWLGYYEHESKVALEKIVQDVLGDEFNFPIIKSNNFGHTETKTVIPIGVKANINTEEETKIQLIEACVK